MRHLRRVAAALMLVTSLSLLGWGFWPAVMTPHVLNFTPVEIALPAPGASPPSTGGMPAILESRQLTLEYPGAIRAGDSAVARLSFDVQPASAGQATPGAPTGSAAGTAGPLLDVFQTHSVVAEADLDLAGVGFEPNGPVSEPLLPGESASFRWNLGPVTPGTYRGTAWLFLVFTDRATGGQSRLAVSAQPVEIEAMTLLGMGGGAARAVGGVGAVIGAVLGLPSVEALTFWLKRRRPGRE